MRIDLKTIYAGPLGTLMPGIRDLDDDLAGPLIAAGYATAVIGPEEVAVPAEQIEIAVIEPPETAARRTGRGVARKRTEGNQP